MGYNTKSDGYVVIGNFNLKNSDRKYDKLLSKIVEDSAFIDDFETDWQYSEDFDDPTIEICEEGFGKHGQPGTKIWPVVPDNPRVKQLLNILREFYNKLNDEDKKLFKPEGNATYWDGYNGGTYRGLLVIGNNKIIDIYICDDEPEVYHESYCIIEHIKHVKTVKKITKT